MKSKTFEDYLHSKYIESSLYGSIVEKVMENIPLTKQLTKHLEKTMNGEGCLTIMTLGYEGPEEIVYKKVRIADKIAQKFGGLKFEDEEYYKKRFGGTLEHMQEMLIHVNESNLEKNASSTLDIGVPHNKILELSETIHRLSKKYQSIQLLDIDVYSHSTALGIDFLISLDKQKEYDLFMKELKNNVVKFGGSLSFAHGVGVRFIKDMKTMYDQPYIEVMKKIKDSLDPNGILNPGKLGGYDEAG
jgi:FAD/FMN-containing dehydrogenase